MNTKKSLTVASISLLLIIILISYSSCKKDESTPPTPIEDKTMDELVIPEGFTFETCKEVVIQFQDQLKAGGSARYDVFLHSVQVFEDTVHYINESGEEVIDTISRYDETNDLIARKVTETGFFELLVTVPTYITELYVIKNELGVFTSSIVQINNKSGMFKSGFKNLNDDPVDQLYGVNREGDLFTINPETGESVIIDQLLTGSYACAVDYINKKLYTIGSSRPYPLHKYDLVTQEFEFITNLRMGGPRLDYNHNDGLLYFSSRDKFYSIDPNTGDVLTQKKIHHLGKKDGGDLKIDADGKWYIATLDGVYWLEFKTKKIHAHRISEHHLPFKPTSMTIDSNGELWLATDSHQGRLVVMDKNSGEWEYRFPQFTHAIDDLSSSPLEETTVIEDDIDGDGVIDYYDEYPNDPDRAYNTYTPSVFGISSLAFEDLWPTKGDYDFNDLLINYRYVSVMNAQDKVVELRADFTVEHIGASFSNGFGFELPFHPGLITSVTGYNITSGLVNINAKGLEVGHDIDKAVIIVFDNAQANIYLTLSLLIEFDEPLEPSLVGVPPFNPFIFTNGDRGREIHLINMPPTDLANLAFFGTGDDNSIPEEGKYYRTANKLPWAINMMHGFVVPLEGKQINQAYTKFNEWAESGGDSYSDWYKDNPGYRDEGFLKN